MHLLVHSSHTRFLVPAGCWEVRLGMENSREKWSGLPALEELPGGDEEMGNCCSVKGVPLLASEGGRS